MPLLRSHVLSYENWRQDEERFEYYTGMTPAYWKVLWEQLDPSDENILSQEAAATEESGRLVCHGHGRRSKLSLEDQLLMTLMRLRLGRLEQDLAYEFGVHQTTVSRIFMKWINYMYLRLGDVPLWPTWSKVESSMPSVFKNAYPTTFCIIDATELHCEVPSSLSLQSQHYSAYKSHTTKKGLVAIAPNGTFIFVSELFSGAISDRQIVLDSGILDLLDDVPEGKSVIADRGFDIQNLLVNKHLLLNIPAFKGSKPHLKKEDVVSTQKIARVRIHVERAIGQVKHRFHIFDSVIPLSLAGSINQIWTVYCLLCDYSGPLIIEEISEE